MKIKLIAAFLMILVAYGISLSEGRGKEGQQMAITRRDVDVNSFDELCVLTRLENEIVATGNAKVSYTSLYPDLYAGTTSGKSGVEVVSKEENSGNTVYLTFDDGPSRNTGKLINILEEKGIRATFFVVGENMTESGLECLKEYAAAGHVIGLHSYSHDYNKIYSSVEAFLEDYNKLFELIVKETGVAPSIYRFPGGSCNIYGKKIIKEIKTEMERRGFTYYDWNVSGEDSVGTPTAYSIKKNIFDNLEKVKNPVILLHDSPINELTISIVPEIIDTLLEKGYVFDTLDKREVCQFDR